jgi:predicted transcriptional regulator
VMEALGNGNAIRSAREGIRVTQSALAREAGISQSFLARVESGERRLTPELTQKVWAALSLLDENYCRPILIRLEGDRPVVTGTEQL